MEFKHYIITRYNLNFRDWKQDKNGKEIRDAAWLLNRKLLFFKYCVPSIKNQTNQNFEWLVLTDGFGPKLHFGPGIVQLRLDSSAWIGGLQRWLKRHCDKKYIITTRLDNDDMLHETAIEDIQNCFDRQENEYINLYAGWIKSGRKVYRIQHGSNQFISRIEKADKLKTVYETTHGAARRNGPVRQLTNRRYWVRIAHERNMVRDNLGNADYCGNLQLEGFGQ